MFLCFQTQLRNYLWPQGHKFCYFRQSKEIIDGTGLLNKQTSLKEFNTLLSVSKNTSNQVNDITDNIDSLSSRVKTRETVSRYLQFGRAEKVDRFAQAEAYFHKESASDDPMGLFLDKLVDDIAFNNSQLDRDQIKNSLLQMEGDLMSFYKEALDSHGKNYCEKAVEALTEEIGEYAEAKFNYLAGGENAPEEIEQWYHGQDLEAKLVEHFQSKGFLEKDLSPSMRDKILKRLQPLIARLKQAHGQEFCKEAFKDQKNQATELFDEYKDKFLEGDFSQMNLDEIQSYYLKKLKQLGPMKATPKALRPQMQQHLNTEWERIKSDIFEQRKTNAKKIIESLDLNAVKIDFNDKNNRDPKLFRQNFAEIVSFDDDTWRAVETQAKDKFDALHQTFMEQLNPVAKEMMKAGWDDFWKEMRRFNDEPKTGKDFFDSFTSFLVKNKGLNSADVQQYFRMHPNFESHIESMHETYQKERKEKISQQNQSMQVVLSPLSQTAYPYADTIRKAILKSFNNTADLEQRDVWMKELSDRYIQKYKQAMTKLADQRGTAKEKFGKLKNSEKAQALRKNMMETVHSYRNTWNAFDANFKGPHDLNEVLAKQMDALKSIEKEWDKKVKDVRKQINSMSLHDITDLTDPKKQALLKNNISTFAKEFNIWTDADVWQEVKNEFGQKMLALHDQLKTGSGESREAKELSVTLKGMKDIEQMTLDDSVKFDPENNDLMDFSVFRKTFDIQMPQSAWLREGKKAFDIKALELHREFGQKRREYFRKKINTLDFKTDITQQTELVDLQAFRRHPDLAVQMTQSEWQQWGKQSFDNRVDTLYQQFRSERESMYTNEIHNLSLNDLPETSLKDPRNADLGNFRQQFDVWMSDEEWGRFGKDVFDRKINSLFQDFLEKQKEGDESFMSHEAQEAVKIIDTLSLDDLDNTKLYTDFTTFKRQPFFQEKISFDDTTWKQVEDQFQLKAAALFAEHQLQMSPQNRLKKLGQKYDLYRMENIPAHSVQDFEKKIVRLEELLKKNSLSVKKFIEYNERERIPFLLDMLGEMHLGDMRELMTDMPESLILNPQEFTNILCGNVRRQYVLGEAIRKNSYNWYWFTTKNQDLPIDKNGQLKEIEGLTDEQVKAPDLDEVRVDGLDLDQPELGEARVEGGENLEDDLEGGESGEVIVEDAEENVDFDLDEASDEDLEAGEELNEAEIEDGEEQDEENLDSGDEDNLEEGGGELGDENEEVSSANLEASNNVAQDVEDVSEIDNDNRERLIVNNIQLDQTDEDLESLLDYAEDGNEDSLLEDWDANLIPGTTPQQFADQYIKQGMQLKQIIERLHRYVELTIGRDVALTVNISAEVQKTYVARPKILFQKFSNFVFDQTVETIETLVFNAKLPTKKSVAIVCLIHQKPGIIQKNFRALLA